ncbi:MAG: hypothetical protein WCK63_15130 [Betaproteobacteria bacterium]
MEPLFFIIPVLVMGMAIFLPYRIVARLRKNHLRTYIKLGTPDEFAGDDPNLMQQYSLAKLNSFLWKGDLAVLQDNRLKWMCYWYRISIILLVFVGIAGYLMQRA